MPSSIRSSLKLIVPGFTQSLSDVPSRMPALERLIAYGSLVQKSPAHRSHELWQGELISALQLGDVERYPSSPLSWLGAGGARLAGTWMHVDPVRMEMSAEGVSLRPAAAWSTKQFGELVQLFSAHLESTGSEIRSLNGSIFVYTTREVSVQSASVQYALSQPLRDVLPTGNDAASMRRLMTELQMLMYEKFEEANAANAAWIWGIGPMSDPIQKPLPSLWTDEPFARGVYLIHEQDARCAAIPNSMASIFDHATESVVVVREPDANSLDARIFAPVLAALERGRFDSVDLFLDGFTIRVRRSFWRRYFARARPIAEVLQ